MTRKTLFILNPEIRGAIMLGFGFGGYSALVISLSAYGVFAAIDVNLFAATVVAATVGLAAFYFLSSAARSLAKKLGSYGLAGFHIWRIPAALIFFYYGTQGLLPDIFVTLAGGGDMLTGILAVIIFLVPRSVKAVTGFHIIGFADFVVAVGTGITLTVLAPDSMSNVVLLPVSLIPLVGVPLSGATHIAALHQLITERA